MGNPKSVPELTSPGLIFRANCTYLGKHSGRDPYLSPDGLELEVVGARIDPNDPAAATARYFKEPQAGGGYRLQEVKAYVVGAFAVRTSVTPKVAGHHGRAVRLTRSTRCRCSPERAPAAPVHSATAGPRARRQVVAARR